VADNDRRAVIGGQLFDLVRHCRRRGRSRRSRVRSRAEIDDNAGSRIEGDADPNPVERRAVGMPALFEDRGFTFSMEIQNGKGALAAMDGVVGIIKWRIVERGGPPGTMRSMVPPRSWTAWTIGVRARRTNRL